MKGREDTAGGGMGGEMRSKSGFCQGMTKTRISNSRFASSRMNWRGNSPVVQGYNSVLPLYTGYIPGLGNKMPRPRKERIKWGKHKLLLRMTVKRKTVGKGPLETLFSHQGPFQRQLIQNQLPGPRPGQKRSRCCPLVDESVTARV